MPKPITRNRSTAAKSTARTPAKGTTETPDAPPAETPEETTGATPEETTPESREETPDSTESATTVKVGNFMFTKEAIPTRITSKESTPNPFTDVFPSDDAALVSVLDVPLHDEKDNDKDHPQIATLKTQARKAATNVDRTARVKVEAAPDSTDEKPRTKVSVWTTKRITRPRKGKDATVSDSTTESGPVRPESDSSGEETDAGTTPNQTDDSKTVAPEENDAVNNGQTPTDATGAESAASADNTNTATE